MLTRVLTAVAALAVVLPIIIWGGFWGLVGLVSVFMLLAVYEFSRMIQVPRSLAVQIFDYVAALATYGVILFGGERVPVFLAPIVLGVLTVHLFAFRDIQVAGQALFGSLASMLYAPLLLAFVPLIRLEKWGLHWIFFIMIVTWAGDTGAYLAGRAFGRHKLYPDISPKKTVEGAIGGIALAIALAFAARATFFPELTVLECLILAPVLDIAGVVGDLTESLMKRSAGVKDSGAIFPGHGGVLDRLDSLLFSAPVLYGYILWR